MKESGWYKITICVKCLNRLSENEKMYSGGVCVECGHDSKSTMCETKNVILKECSHNPWWKFWDKKYTYKGVNEFSTNWSKSH